MEASRRRRDDAAATTPPRRRRRDNAAATPLRRRRDASAKLRKDRARAAEIKSTRYALKLVSLARLVDQKQVERMLEEKRVLEGLEHPCVVRLHFAFRTPGHACLGFERRAGVIRARGLAASPRTRRRPGRRTVGVRTSPVIFRATRPRPPERDTVGTARAASSSTICAGGGASSRTRSRSTARK